jgi:hypothetical protein
MLLLASRRVRMDDSQAGVTPRGVQWKCRVYDEPAEGHFSSAARGGGLLCAVCCVVGDERCQGAERRVKIQVSAPKRGAQERAVCLLLVL